MILYHPKIIAYCPLNLIVAVSLCIMCHYQFRYKNSKIAILIVKNTIKNSENN